MCLDVFFACTEHAGNLLVQSACHDQRHHLALPGRQPFETLTHLSESVSHRLQLLGAFKGVSDRAEQIGIGHRFRKEVSCPRFHRLHGHGDASMAGQENDRQPGIELALQFQTAAIGQLHIEYQARRTCVGA